MSRPWEKGSYNLRGFRLIDAYTTFTTLPANSPYQSVIIQASELDTDSGRMRILGVAIEVTISL